MKKRTLVDRVLNALGYVKEVAISSLSKYGIPASPPRKQKELLEAYRSWVFAAAKARGEDTARMKLRLYRVVNRKDGETEEVTDHEVLSLLRLVNPWTTGRQLLEYSQIYSDLVGEWFWYLNWSGGVPGKGKITQIWPLRPDWISVKTSKDQFILGYEYRVPGLEPIPLKIEEIIHYREFNPTDPYRGMGIVAAAAESVDSETYAERYNRKFFENSAVPSVVLSTEQRLTTDLVNRMREEWYNEYSTKDRPHKVAILEAGVELKPFMLSQKEMEFLSGIKWSAEKILALFSMPKSRLGMTEGITVANFESSERAYLKYTIRPLMEKMRDALNEFLLPHYAGSEDIFFDFDDPVPESITNRLEIYKTLFALGALTPNEIRQEEGLDEAEGLNDYFVPINMLRITDVDGQDEEEVPADPAAQGTQQEEQKKKPAGRRVKVNIPPPTLKQKVVAEITEKVSSKLIGGIMKTLRDGEAAIDEEQIGKTHWSEEQQEAFWKALIVHTENFEKEYAKLIRSTFRRQAEEMVARVERVVGSKAVFKGTEEDIQRILFKITSENKAVASLAVPLLKELIEEVGEEVFDFLGIPERDFDGNVATLNQFLKSDALKGIRSLNSTTRRKMKVLLANAFAEGKSGSQISTLIEAEFDSMGPVRADMIARTETLKASNRATLEGYKQSGVVVGKQWFTAVDERVCPMCEPLHGKVVSVDRDFFTQGETQVGNDGKNYKIDYEDIPAPPRHASCRCTLVPVVLRR